MWRTPFSVVPIHRTVHHNNESWSDGRSPSRKIQMCSCVKCTRVSGNFSLMLSIKAHQSLSLICVLTILVQTSFEVFFIYVIILTAFIYSLLWLTPVDNGAFCKLEILNLIIQTQFNLIKLIFKLVNTEFDVYYPYSMLNEILRFNSTQNRQTYIYFKVNYLTLRKHWGNVSTQY